MIHMPSIALIETIILALVAGLSLLVGGLVLTIVIREYRGRNSQASPQPRSDTTTSRSSNPGIWLLLSGLAVLLAAVLTLPLIGVASGILIITPVKSTRTDRQGPAPVLRVVSMPSPIGTSLATTSTPTPTHTPQPPPTPTSISRSSAAPTDTPPPPPPPTSTSRPTSPPASTPDSPLQTISFTASPDPVARGGAVTLTWNAPGASRVGITRLSPEGDIFLETEALDLPASGSIALQVPEEYTEAVKYYLGARDAKGVLHKAYVTVGIICRYDEYMAPRCPLTQDAIWAAYEPFERGHMVWRSDTREIYVLYTAGSRYKVYDDTWNEGDPVDIPGTPPPGLQAPVRGFGNLYAHQPHVREGLGWATTAEAGYTMAVETIRGGSGFHRSISVYFTLPDNRVVNLYPFTSTWEIIP